MKATDTYHIALHYLMNKYGVKRLSLSCSFENKIRHLKTSEYRQAIANATDDDYNITYSRLPDDADMNDREIQLLLCQYSLSRVIENELRNKLISMKIITEQL